MTEIALYISGTRRSLPHRLQPALYESHIAIANEIIEHNSLEASIALCYTSERRVETLRSSKSKVILYDQYLGQTLSNLSRIVHENSTSEQAINYVSKIIAEFFRAYGCTRESFAFARIYSVDVNKIKNIPKDSQRLLRTYYQEQFLILHEVFHVAIQQRQDMREHVDDIIKDYFNERRKALEETAGLKVPDFLSSLNLRASDFAESVKCDTGLLDLGDLDYPKFEEVAECTLDEMACDYLAWVAVTHFAEQFESGVRSNAKRLAALSCLEAIKNIQIVNTLRNSVKIFSRGISSSDFSSNYQRRDDVIRSRFVNWLINLYNDSEEWSKEIMLEIDEYYIKYQNKLAIIANTIAQAIAQRQIERIFAEDFDFVDKYVISNDMTLNERNAVVDVITGWSQMDMDDSTLKSISDLKPHVRDGSHVRLR